MGALYSLVGSPIVTALDLGKLQKNTIVKTINIDPKSDINNVIFIKEINDTLVAATSKKLISFVDGKVNLKDIDVQSIIVHKNANISHFV